MGKATIAKADGTEEALDHRPTLAEAQKICGGYIELVSVAGNKTLVVDEEGLLKNYNINPKGCQLYGGMIVGDIIILEGYKTVGG